jgi:ABC-2 type transport system permease protein
MGSFVGLVVLGVLVAGVAFLTTRNLTVTSVAGAAVLIPVSLLYIFLKDRFAGLLPAVLEFVSPFLHFQQVANYGLLSIPSFVLLLSYPVFFVFLTVQSADKKRWD